MSAATGYIAYGTKLHCDPAGGTSYVELADIKDINATWGPKYPAVDFTPLAPSTALRGVKPGIGAPATWSFRQFYTPTRWTTLETPYKARTTCAWKAVWPDTAGVSGSLDVMSGFITNLHKEGTGSPDDPIYIVCEVQNTTDVTNTPAS